ncbi:unnamed protein product [Kluyveromyces dobzhanskii CBS 2104]|uniref:WGS project CCBQ000000000 data, contig 00010 n=1 Tax=Kluyveromyces dobzhanskii CBS 2104 TaxID=1427455 RepID=A0A0A8LCY8_9SACH|nr:unnamed protein product [Kluyveromyces dobzhanskii CBS 2104]
MSTEKKSNYQMLTVEEIRRRKNAEKGIQFCMLVIGESGSGNSTFCNNICNEEVFKHEKEGYDPANAHLNPGISIVSKNFHLQEENSTPISLDIVLIPGLGDNIDNSANHEFVVDYLESQFDRVLNEEIRIKRNSKSVDTRPHVCLYFIRATSKGLRELDINLMKALCDKVNIIPVISKADLLTDREIALNKRLIMEDIYENGIRIYDFGDDKLADTLMLAEPSAFSPIPNNSSYLDSFHSSDSGERTTPTNSAGCRIKDMLPFSIIGSNETEYENGELFHVRKYPWGTIKIEDKAHCDFIYLKSILLGSHLQDLKETTHNRLYENYRTKKLLANSNNVSDHNGKSVLAESTVLEYRIN